MKKLPLVLAVLLALGLGVALFAQSRAAAELRSKLNAAESELAQRTSELDAQNARIADLQNRNDALRTESETLRGRLASVPADAPREVSTEHGVEEASPQDQQQEEPGGDMMKSIAKMYSDPEMRKMMRSQQTLGIQMMYGDLAKELGLSPDEAKKVMELLADRQMALTTEGMKMLTAGNDDQAIDETGKSVAASRDEYDKQLKAVLGDERAKQLENYERTLGDRMQLQQYQASFAASGIPLSDQQRTGLLQIMTEERLKAPPSVFDPGNRDVGAQMRAMRSGEGMEQLMEMQRELNQRVLTRAHTVLSPDQMNAFESAQKAQFDMQQMGIKMGQQMMKGREKKQAPSAPLQPVETQ